MKNVVVLGGSYGGASAANRLAQILPKEYRVILVERNTHANHLYVFPRLAVLPGHEHKAFVPYTHIFNPIPQITNDSGSNDSSPSSSRPGSPEPSEPSEPAEPEATQPRHIFLNAHVTAVSPRSVTLSRAFPEYGFPGGVVEFEYAIYALGSRLPGPIDLWAEAGMGESVGGEGEGEGEGAADAAELEAVVAGAVSDAEADSTKPQPTQADSTIVPAPSHPSVDSEDSNSDSDSSDAPTTPTKTDTVPYEGTKREAVEWMQRCQERVKKVGSVLVVGGGALGIQFATDIKSLYPDKRVTLLHSRNRLLPRYASEMHSEIMKAMTELGINVMLDERLDLSTVASPVVKGVERVVRTMKGREISAELVMLCTGQTPNTALLRAMDPSIVRPDTGLACVLRTMQVGWCGQEGDWRLEEEAQEKAVEEQEEIEEEEEEDDEGVDGVTEAIEKATLDSSSTPGKPKPRYTSPYPRLFVIGDAADAFGAIKAGHVAYYQAIVAVGNIMKLIGAREEGVEEGKEGVKEEEVELDDYAPGAPAIKVSLGLSRPAVYEIQGQFGLKEGEDDLDAGSIWPYFGFHNPTAEDMYL